MKSKILKRIKGYSIEKKLFIGLLLLIGFAIGFIIGYMRGAADVSAFIIKASGRFIDSANVTINFKSAIHDYLLKGGY